MDNDEINEKLSTLATKKFGKFWCGTTGYNCGGDDHESICSRPADKDCEWKVKNKPIDYCSDIQMTVHLAFYLGINFFKLCISPLDIDIEFMINDIKRRKLRIVPKGYDIYHMEAYARAALLLECCVLEGLA